MVQPRTGVELEGFEEIHAQSWVTLLARMPIKDQSNQYDDALESARGFQPNRDVPMYLGYIVEHRSDNRRAGPMGQRLPR